MPPPTQAEIYARATAFKDDLIANERQASARIVDAYGRAFGKMTDNIRVLTEKIEQARLSGQYISPSWAFQIDRYQALQRQIATEIGRIANQVNDATIRQQSDAVNRAANDIGDLTNMAAQNAGVSVSFSRLATSASESIVGFLSDGSPLKSLLDQLPVMAGQAVANALTDAILRGQNPTRTATQIRAALGGNMNRALTIARTETMRAYREASHRTLAQNTDILQGWVWVASFSRRTCASCLALAGSVHRIEERMESHPRCRCSQAPLIRGQRVEFEKGEDWFARQDPTTQRSILGSHVALKAYQRGDATLLDFVGRQNSPKWGQPYYQLSTRRAILKQGVFPGYNHPTQFETFDEIFKRGGFQPPPPPIPPTPPTPPVPPVPPVTVAPPKRQRRKPVPPPAPPAPPVPTTPPPARRRRTPVPPVVPPAPPVPSPPVVPPTPAPPTRRRRTTPPVPPITPPPQTPETPPAPPQRRRRTSTPPPAPPVPPTPPVAPTVPPTRRRRSTTPAPTPSAAIVPIQDRTTPVVYKKAKSIAEAERFLRESGIAVTVDYSKMTLDDANAINKRMIDVWQKWKLEQIDRLIPSPAVQGIAHAHGQLIEYNPSDFDPQRLKSLFLNNVTNYQVNKQNALNAAMLDPTITPAELQKMSEQSRFRRFLALTDPNKVADHVITHEMGHVIHDQLIGGSNLSLMQFKHRVPNTQAMMLFSPQRKPEVQSLHDRWLAIFSQARPGDFLKVSAYSRTKHQEYFAESFLMYNVEPQNLPSNVKSFFDDLLKFARKP